MNNEIPVSRIVQAIAAIKALETAYFSTGGVTTRLVTDLTIAKCDLENALMGVRLTIKEAA